MTSDARVEPAGPAAWRTSEWVEEATVWLDRGLAAHGLSRVGSVLTHRIRPWAAVLTAPTDAGPVWLKACAPTTSFEVQLYRVLGETVPDRVLAPLATDPARGWLLLPDSGPSLADGRAEADADLALADPLLVYGDVQRALAERVPEMLVVGVADMRPRMMLDRFEEALEATGPIAADSDDPDDRSRHRRVGALRPRVAEWCAQLAASAVPDSLDHNDLHPGNVLPGAAGVRFYDWGDAVVAHALAGGHLPLRLMAESGGGDTDARYVAARDAYLDGFADLAPGEDLRATLRVARQLAKVTRVLTWDRAVAAARRTGDESVGKWADAPLRALFTLLDPPPV